MTAPILELECLEALLVQVKDPDRDLDLRLFNALVATAPWVWRHHGSAAICPDRPDRRMSSIPHATGSIDDACKIVMAAKRPLFPIVAQGAAYAKGLKTYLLDPAEYHAVIARSICLMLVRDVLADARLKEPAVA